MRGILALLLCIGIVSTALADQRDYTGPFTTEVLYQRCSRDDATSRAECDMYIQGLVYGLRVARSFEAQGMSVCVPEIAPDAARLRILRFIDQTTGGRPANNKDGGNWMAFMALAAGNLCKK